MYTTEAQGQASSRKPTLEQLQYVKVLLEVALLLLGLPWILKALLHNPEQAVRDPGLGSLG